MISKLQPMLYAQHKYGVVIVLQALDAAGKDSLIAHTFSGLNPAWFDVVNFKQPSSIDLDHDFLWRINQQLPPRGMLGIFNRSYYEDVLISRVHPEILLNENLPGINNLKDLNEEFYEYRYQDIQNYENYLNHAGYVVIKIFLHISKEEQLQRFLDRINTPDKQWKFSASDVHEHKFFLISISMLINVQLMLQLLRKILGTLFQQMINGIHEQLQQPLFANDLNNFLSPSQKLLRKTMPN